MKTVVLGVCFPLLLAACATAEYKLTPQSQEGAVTGSVSYLADFSVYRVHYRQLPGPRKGVFETGAATVAQPIPDRGDFNETVVRGTVFAAPLPAGDYEVHAWSMGSGPTHAASTAPFSVRFTVEPGKLVYLGNFHFAQTASYGPTIADVKVSYRDAFARDVPVFKRKFPGLAEIPLAYAAERGAVHEDLGGRPDKRSVAPIVLVPSQR